MKKAVQRRLDSLHSQAFGDFRTKTSPDEFRMTGCQFILAQVLKAKTLLAQSAIDLHSPTGHGFDCKCCMNDKPFQSTLYLLKANTLQNSADDKPRRTQN